MGKIKNWLTTPVKPKKRYNVLLGAAIEALAIQLRQREVRDLRKRIETLEARTPPTRGEILREEASR